MPASLEVLFAPAEFQALRDRDLSHTACVVFDILRATSTMMAALGNGAAEIVPVAEIEEALAFRRLHAGVLLAGERNGLRIRAEQTGGLDFDLGNSPREFAPSVVRDKTIVITTTNGTRGLRACAAAQVILIGSFLGLGAVADWIGRTRPLDLILVCAGTVNQASYEDTVAAGALCELIWSDYLGGQVADSAVIARQVYHRAASDLLGAMQSARNARRLLANPDLSGDVMFCLQRDVLDFVAEMTPSGRVRRIATPAV